MTGLSPSKGGPTEVLRQLARASRDGGEEMEILCLDDPGEPFLAGWPCPMHALGQSFLGAYGFSPRLWRWLRDHACRFDAMVMHGIWSFPSVALRLAARHAGTPYGVFIHGALDPWFAQKYPIKHLKKLLYWRVQYPVLRDASAVFFTANAERDLAKKGFRPNRWNSVVVPLGITDPKQCGTGSASPIVTLNQRLPQLRGRRYLLFLARIHPKKGCDLLIEGFARMASEVPDVDIVMAGPDQDGWRDQLQRLAERRGIAARVHWPGMIHGDLKWDALRACDAFVLPSHSENFGIAVVESLAAGTPVLISKRVNIWQEVEGDGAGLAEDDTVAGTERLLRRWFSLSPAEREAMAAQARLAFERRFTMDRTAQALHRFFTSAAPPSSLSHEPDRASGRSFIG
ncbi:MAG: glycosyltransferase [Acidobacteriota bacterium]